MSPCLVAQTPMDKLITDIAFLVIAHHGGIQKPWEEEKAENEKHDESILRNYLKNIYFLRWAKDKYIRMKKKNLPFQNYLVRR